MCPVEVSLMESDKFSLLRTESQVSVQGLFLSERELREKSVKHTRESLVRENFIAFCP